MKKYNSIVLILASVFMLFVFSCKKDNAGMSLNLDGDVNISSFKVDSATASIDTTDGTIAISLPFGTDFTKVMPTITLPQGATVSPASGAAVSLKNPVQYRVINGNIYKDYVVSAVETPAILLFKAEGDTGAIDESARTIKVIVPAGSDLTKVNVDIKLAAGATITPASGSTVDFTNPVTFTVKTAIASVNYTVTAIDANADKPVAFIGNYDTKDQITNADEKAAADWLFTIYAKAEYVSLTSIQNGTTDLSKYSVIWWHEDETQTLPNIAYDANVIAAMEAYRNNGGNLLLTTFAARWVDALGIVPAGKGPNNVFGDSYGNQRQDGNSNWGVSISPTQASHPIFAGLPLAADKSYPVVYLLDKNAFRLNHVGWWKVDEWGGYGDAAGWRSQTGGIDLAGPDGSDNTNSNITIAEFPKGATNGATIVVTPGSYDWYAEPNPATGAAGPANSFLSNVKKLTQNAIEYLKKQ
ncbi:MAG: DUF4960 domain-containing protein [Ginsengibacter sp.]